METNLTQMDELIEREKRIAALEVHSEAWADGAMEGQPFPAGTALGHGLVSGLADSRAEIERRIRFRHLG